MQKRSFLSLLIILITIVLVINSPSFAYSSTLFTRSVAYRIGGNINIRSEIGGNQLDYTGSSRSQTIRGDGQVTKSETVKIAPYIMRVEDNISWLTYAEATRNITVINNIQLFAKPISAAASTYDTGSHVIEVGDIVNPYLPIVIEGNIFLNPLSRQVWYTRISSDPLHSGTLKSEYVSAYGPGPYELNRPNYDPDHSWWFDGIIDVDYGNFYVGNYFEIHQYLHTSRGDTRRLIDISSPFSNALLSERMRIIGSLTVREDFKMKNIGTGKDAITMHWSDFDLFF